MIARTGFIILLSSTLWGQINIERFRGSNTINISASFGYSETKTNKTEKLDLSLHINRARGNNEWLLVGGTNFAEKNDDQFQDKGFAHARYFYRFKNFGPEAFVQTQENQFSNQRRRTLYGVGVRQIFTGTTHRFRGGTSIMREFIRIEQSNGGATDLWFTRLNNYFNYIYRAFSMTLYYQPSLDDFSNNALAVDAFITFDLWKDRLKLDIKGAVIENDTLNIKDRSISNTFRYKI